MGKKIQQKILMLVFVVIAMLPTWLMNSFFCQCLLSQELKYLGANYSCIIHSEPWFSCGESGFTKQSPSVQYIPLIIILDDVLRNSTTGFKSEKQFQLPDALLWNKNLAPTCAFVDAQCVILAWIGIAAPAVTHICLVKIIFLLISGKKSLKPFYNFCIWTPKG